MKKDLQDRLKEKSGRKNEDLTFHSKIRRNRNLCQKRSTIYKAVFLKKKERQNEDLRLTKWSMNLLSKTSNTSRLTSNLGF